MLHTLSRLVLFPPLSLPLSSLPTPRLPTRSSMTWAASPLAPQILQIQQSPAWLRTSLHSRTIKSFAKRVRGNVLSVFAPMILRACAWSEPLDGCAQMLPLT